MSPSPSALLPDLAPTESEANSKGKALRHRHATWGRVIARSVWLVLTGTAVFLFLFSLPTYDAQLQIVCPGLPSCSFFGQLSRGTLPFFQQAHLSVAAYAAAFLALVSLNGLLAVLFGSAILWRLWGKDNELLGLLTSFVLILGGTIATKNGDFANFAPATPLVLNIVGSLAFLLYWPALAVVAMTFPTGRFAPRWTWLLLVPWLLQEVFFGIIATSSPLLFSAERLLVYGSTYAVLFYRARRLYTPVQRQQTKWLLYGFVPFSLLQILSGALQSLPALNTPSSLYLVMQPLVEVLSFLLVPVAIGIALLRYRLWDIDVLINRTLVYGSLTALLGALYAGLILALESLAGLFGGQAASNPLALVISTLVIAALVLPVRRRVQSIIDRRFFRRKYDAEKTLAAFSASLRQQVDLEQVRTQLLAVVQETMQPAQASLWLRQPERRSSEEAHRLEPQADRPEPPKLGLNR